MRNRALAVVAYLAIVATSTACTLESEPGSSPAADDSSAALARPAWFEANQGIEFADLRALALQPLSPRALYAALPSGGLYKSVNDGLSWARRDRGLPTMSVYAVAVDPSDASVVYAGLAQAGLYKSVDGGAAFAATGLEGASVFTIEVAPSDPAVVYAATPFLSRSDDAGASFTLLTSSPQVSRLVVSPSDPFRLYALGGDARVYASSDGGASFTDLSAGLPASLHYGASTLTVDPTDFDVVYVGISGSGLFRSRDGGASWQPIGADVANGQSYDVIAIDPRAPRTLYLSASVFPRPGAQFKSTDGGESWSTLSYPNSVFEILIDPADSARVYLAGAGEGFIRSTDGLASSRRSIRGMHNENVVDLAPDELVASLAYAGTSHGLFTTWSAGALWLRARSIPLTRVTVESDPNHGGTAYAGADASPQVSTRGQLFRTRNGGLTWSNLTRRLPLASASVEPLAVAPGRAGIVFVRAGAPSESLSQLLESRDGGASWSTLETPGAPLRMVALSDRKAVLMTPGSLYRTDDGAASWTDIRPPGLFVTSFAVSRSQPDIIYAANDLHLRPTDAIGLRKSLDGGITWSTPSVTFANRAVSSVSVHPQDGRVYLVSPDPVLSGVNAVYVSTNGGLDFVSANRGLEGQWTNLIVPHPRLRCLAYAGTSTRAVFASLTGAGTCDRTL